MEKTNKWAHYDDKFDLASISGEGRRITLGKGVFGKEAKIQGEAAILNEIHCSGFFLHNFCFASKLCD